MHAPRPMLLLLLHDHQTGCTQHVLCVGAQLLAEFQSHQGPALLQCSGSGNHMPCPIAASPMHLQAWLTHARSTCT